MEKMKVKFDWDYSETDGKELESLSDDELSELLLAVIKSIKK